MSFISTLLFNITHGNISLILRRWQMLNSIESYAQHLGPLIRDILILNNYRATIRFFKSPLTASTYFNPNCHGKHFLQKVNKTKKLIVHCIKRGFLRKSHTMYTPDISRLIIELYGERTTTLYRTFYVDASHFQLTSKSTKYT